MKLLAAVVDLLNAARVHYALVGAGAMAAHGVARSTFDVDLLTTDARVLADECWQPFKANEAIGVDVHVGEPDDPLAGITRLTADENVAVDVVVGRAGWQDGVIGRARSVTITGVTLPVVTIADLIVLKLYAGGAQDAWDIEQLLRAGDEDAIRAAVDPVVAQLPLDARALWERLGGPPA